MLPEKWCFAFAGGNDGFKYASELNNCLFDYSGNFAAQMHALALKDKEEEHAGLLHTAGEIQVRYTRSKIRPDAPCLINDVKSKEN